jgi:hypothetical protein
MAFTTLMMEAQDFSETWCPPTRLCNVTSPSIILMFRALFIRRGFATPGCIPGGFLYKIIQNTSKNSLNEGGKC